MSKKKAFWFIWLLLSSMIICFFFVIGVLDRIDFGKSIILTIILLLTAYPIKRFVKSNEEFYDD